MRRLFERIVIGAIFVFAVAGTVGLLGARELNYQYNRNGHSLNPLKYTLTMPVKIRFGQPFWRGRWSARHV
ncbi:MAG TPA: hypothetical protein VIY48_22505 [Candidatus Paceibacterota bacterium]